MYKYITDITVGNFIFNYISNLIHLKKEFTPRWQERQIRSALLRGDEFANIKAISPSTLSTIRATLTRNLAGTTEYQPTASSRTASADAIRRKEDKIARIKVELDALRKDSIFATNLSEEAFVQKAAQFLMSASLKNGSIDFIELAMQADASMLKEFVNAVVSRISVRNRRITQVIFTNGQTHSFEYDI